MTILLLIIYVAFISLGLPDALLGSSWTVMHDELNVPIEFAGAISIVITSGTIISSLMASRLLRWFKTGRVVAFSVAMTSIALFGFSRASSIWMIILFAIPLGLGGGAVDSLINNVVAINYKPRHMNWLHSFWGVGATSGPMILALIIGSNGSWREGYTVVSIIQAVLVAILVITLPLWKPVEKKDIAEEHDDGEFISNRKAAKIKGVKYQLMTFLMYCSLEAGAGLWAASYLMTQRGITPANAAFWTSMYFGGITVGRFISGIISEKVKGENLIRGGLVIITTGVVLMLLPLPNILCTVGLIFIGLGCAPIFPGLLHLTPERFGKKASQSIVGLSMAFAYIGSTIVPPLLGAISGLLSLAILPYALIIFAVGMFFTSERLRKILT